MCNQNDVITIVDSSETRKELSIKIYDKEKYLISMTNAI